jgi:anti-sigma regulatory factor (Ser/Thr protein kinase)
MLLTVLLPVAPAMYWRRTFPGRADQAREVRAFVAAMMPDHPRRDELLLAVGELAANALRHTKSGQGGTVTVDVFRADKRTCVSVTDDGGPTEPVVAEAGEWDESGRGLRTVALLADSWGWHGDDTGRTVTAIFAVESEPGGLPDEGGRGLVIVDAIAACRRHTATAHEKTVVLHLAGELQQIIRQAPECGHSSPPRTP